MKNLHITVTKKGTVEITDTRGTVSFDIERVSIDFDNHSETSYEEHHFAEVVATYKAMQKATEILKAQLNGAHATTACALYSFQ